MNEPSISTQPADRHAGQVQRGLRSLTPNGLGLILLVCVINALRRTLPKDELGAFFSDLPGIAAWLVVMAQTTATGLLVALPVAVAVVAAYDRAPNAPWKRHLVLALVVALTSLAGVTMQAGVEAAIECGQPLGCPGWPLPPIIVQFWARYGTLCALFTVVFVYVRSAGESEARTREAEVERARFVERMEEARLNMLQAQIEPHFLFNTLANVRRLYQVAPGDGARMLDHLMRYLAAALPQMRAARSTLGRETMLAASYLEIQQIRMGRRLAFAIDIPQSLHDAAFPPMMLLTLVENAIKHGVAPLVDGGSVTISADASAGELHVRVADTGAGFKQASGGGTGLANIRARLAALYGAAGRLSLALGSPRGVVASISVPSPLGR